MPPSGLMAKILLTIVGAIDDAVGWPFREPSSRMYRKLNGVGRKWIAKLALRLLTTSNARSTASILGTGPAVSLTSHGSRIATAFATVESIGLGSVRPRRIVLWLDSERDVTQLDERLRRLVARGLEVRLTDNLGPHTKYFPYVDRLWDGSSPLVTADDDILYPTNWLSRLVRAQRDYPDMVNCHRAWTVGVGEGRVLLPYSTWAACSTSRPGSRTFATGVSGVIYPPGMLRLLRDRKLEFTTKCLRADDVWLHYVAVENDIPIRQIRPRGRHFPVVVSAQVVKLQQDNITGLGNDRQIKATYSEAALSRLGVRPPASGAPIVPRPVAAVSHGTDIAAAGRQGAQAS